MKIKRTLFFFVNHANKISSEYSLHRDEMVVYLKKKKKTIIYSNNNTGILERVE